MRFLKTADPKLKKALTKALREAMKPVLERAKNKAMAIADDGTFASSISVTSRSNGALWLLKSTDPAAGVKEFARHGFYYHPRFDDKRPNARKMRRFPGGASARANPPRAMVPAVEESHEEIIKKIDQLLGEVFDEVNNG